MVSRKQGLKQYRKVGIPRPDIFDLLALLVRFGLPFWRPSDFEGGPQIDHFFLNEKKEVQETALKKHDLMIDL